MKEMLVYHISVHDCGSTHIFEPVVPESRLEEEDKYTPRVCAALTVPQCINSKWLFADVCLSENIPFEFFVYAAYVPVEDIIQPSIVSVPDTWMTGELWVTAPHEWKNLGKFIMIKGDKIIDESGFSKYHIYRSTSCAKTSPIAFDGSFESFTMIETDFTSSKFKEYRIFNP